LSRYDCPHYRFLAFYLIVAQMDHQQGGFLPSGVYLVALTGRRENFV
jgi:hypothetical protein